MLEPVPVPVLGRLAAHALNEQAKAFYLVRGFRILMTAASLSSGCSLHLSGWRLPSQYFKAAVSGGLISLACRCLGLAGLIRLTHTQQNPQNLLTGVLLVLLRHASPASAG